MKYVINMARSKATEGTCFKNPLIYSMKLLHIKTVDKLKLFPISRTMEKSDQVGTTPDPITPSEQEESRSNTRNNGINSEQVRRTTVVKAPPEQPLNS